ncbi:MAG: HalD/BesD family halogenase [bacterium]
MKTLIDLQNYPIDQSGGEPYRALVDSCRRDLRESGMFNLPGFLSVGACNQAIEEINPVMDSGSFTHRRFHNVYFLDSIPGVASDHPALKKIETVNHTLCADQLQNSIVIRVYEYPPLIQFLADTLSMTNLYLMDDPLARANVMAYRDGEALNWHFDRSEFTTTLLLQVPNDGGEFQFRTALRSEQDPNYDGVARLIEGDDPQMQSLRLEEGTLSVFRGKNTVHRITPVIGSRERVIAVFSYYEHPGKVFSKEEQIGFYGRAS